MGPNMNPTRRRTGQKVGLGRLSCRNRILQAGFRLLPSRLPNKSTKTRHTQNKDTHMEPPKSRLRFHSQPGKGPTQQKRMERVWCWHPQQIGQTCLVTFPPNILWMVANRHFGTVVQKPWRMMRFPCKNRTLWFQLWFQSGAKWISHIYNSTFGRFTWKIDFLL